MVRIEGMAGSVTYRAQALQALIGGEIVNEGASAALWRAVRDVEVLQGVKGALWRVSVKPSDGPRVLATLGDVPALLDWGGGLLWCVLADDVATSVALRETVGRLGGHATRLRGAADVPDFHPESAPVAALSRALRQQFDPRGIFSPGMMAGE
jgi:glycolate oxidase FAD binding subunit